MRSTVENFKLHLITVVVGVAAALATALGFLTLSGTIFKGDTFKVRALLPTSSSLGGGSRVTMAGAQVGRVTGTSEQGYATLVEMEITDDRVLPIAADSRVTLRQRTPVGENYISIAPGTAKQTLTEESVLPVRQSDEYVEVDQLLSIFQGRTKGEAQRLIQSLGGALEDRGDNLNVVLGRTSEVVQAAGAVLGRLNEDRDQTAALVDNLGRVSAAVGDRGEAIQVTADRGLAALRALAARDDALRDTLEVLPSTLAQVRRTSGTLQSASQVAAPVVVNLAGAMDDLRPAIGNLEPAAATGRRVLSELDGVADPLRSTLEEVTRLSAPLSSALPEVRSTLCQVNPMLRFAAPYTNDFVQAIVGLGSASNSYDAIGHLIRLTPIINENSLAGAPDDVSKAAFTLLRSGLATKGTGLTWNPYPEPDMIGRDGAGDTGNLSGPDALRESGYKFPRVLADC